MVNSDYSNITVLEISNAAIAQARMRLGDAASRIKWLQADILEWTPKERYYLWHDRAVFHFMNDDTSVETYLNAMRTALVPNGFFVLGTFGPEGPNRCSGLDVRRYSIEELTHLLEGDFALGAFLMYLFFCHHRRVRQPAGAGRRGDGAGAVRGYYHRRAPAADGR